MILECLSLGALLVVGGALVRKARRFRHATNDRGEVIAGDDRLVPGDRVLLRPSLVMQRDAGYMAPGTGSPRDPALVPATRRWEGEITAFRIADAEIAHDNAYPPTLLEMGSGRNYELPAWGCRTRSRSTRSAGRTARPRSKRPIS